MKKPLSSPSPSPSPSPNPILPCPKDYFYYKEHLFLVTELLKDNLYEYSRFIRHSGAEPYFTLPR